MTAVLIALLVGMVALAGCGGAEDADEKEAIVITDTQFQTIWINNAIAEFIIEEGYEYPVEIVSASVPVMNQSLRSGESDLHLELWRFNMMEWYTEVTESGEVIDLGPIYDTARQGWYVPRYVIEGDEERDIEPMAPGLTSVLDLPDYWEVFEDPEDPDKGVFLNSIHGWDCTEINTVKMEAYGLTDYYNIQYPGGAAALDTALVRAYERGEPIVAYYWEPTWLMGKYDFVMLEEPEYDPEVQAMIRRALEGDMEASELDTACAYQTHAVHKGINAELRERAPEVVEFVEKMNVGTDPLNETAAYMETEDATAEEAALWYFENQQDRWRSWVPADVEERLETALIEAGADL